MGLRKYKPVTPGRRFASVLTFEELSSKRPERSLTGTRKRRAGRNSAGRVSVRHKGGGHKRLYRIVDFMRDKTGVPAKVAALEYDPNRSARIALLHYVDGEKRYILAPNGLQVGATVLSGPEVEPAVGNCLPVSRIPVGLMVHNVELVPGKGGQMVRSAGQGAQILAKEGGFVHLKLPSGEIRMVGVNCVATVGQVGNVEHNAVSIGKAGRKRWMGIRPTVRGVAMNPIDHPMGGGEGRSSGGQPRSPWGQLSKGKKTRHKKSPSGKFILQRRK